MQHPAVRIILLQHSQIHSGLHYHNPIHQHAPHPFVAFYGRTMVVEGKQCGMGLMQGDGGMSSPMEYSLKMQFSKNKSSCGYAKLAKSKQCLSPADLQPHQQSQPLLEELMNELQAEDSQYIQKLINKQQARTRPLTQSVPSSPKQTVYPQSSQNSSQRPGDRAHQNPSSQPIPRGESCLPQPADRNYFLNRMDDYLLALGHCENLPKRPKRQPPMEREYRRTHDIPQRGTRQQGVSSAKYELLLNKLQQSLLDNDVLEEVIQQQDGQIGELKAVVKAMWAEIKDLESELEQETNQREKMSAALEDLAGRIQYVRSPKQPDSTPHYIPTHQKRNSHIPRSNSRSRQDFNRSELHNILHDRSNQMLRREWGEESQLRKKGKTHKYKLSDCFHSQLASTICDNSFQ